MPTTIRNTDILFNDSSTQNTAATGFGFKNRIINGDMRIDQRNAGASVTPTNGQYTLDRWAAYAFGAATSKFTVQQNAGSVTPPSGFRNYLGATSTSAYSVAAGDITSIYQVIEGFNVADLGWGAAGAQTVTLSFWVRSSLTGTFGGAFKNSAANRAYPFTYAISAANTWEQKTVTVAGDTTGTWNTTNGQGLLIVFSLGTGSTYSAAAGAWTAGDFYSATGATSVVGTNGATFYITGVQLEKGSTATSFDYRPYGTEFMLCQRYYEVISAPNGGMVSVGHAITTAAVLYGIKFSVTKRTTPTFTSSGTWICLTFNGGSGGGALSLSSASTDSARVDISGGSGLTAGNASGLFSSGGTATLNFSSEL